MELRNSLQLLRRRERREKRAGQAGLRNARLGAEELKAVPAPFKFPFMRSILPRRDQVLRHCLVENLVLYNGLFRERFASQGGLDSVKSRGTEQRIALDGAVQLAGDHRVEGRPYSVNRNDQNIGPGFQSGLFDGLNRAQGHIIVVSVNRVDL